MLENGTTNHAINFSISAKEIHDIVDREITLFNKVLDTVASQTLPTFANTVAPIARQDNAFEAATGYALFLQFVSPRKDIREACAAANQKVNDFVIEYGLREDVYRAIRTVFENKNELSNLCYEDRRYVEKCVRQYEHNGMMLSKGKREQLAEITAQLCELETEFYTNICEQDCSVLLSKSELEGVPKEFFDERVPVCTKGVERYAVSAKHHDYSDVLNYAVCEATRKKMFVANGTLCPENVGLLQEAVKQRQLMATLLGYRTYADFILKTQMAQSPENVYKMENELRTKLQKLACEEDRRLKQFKQKHTEETGGTYVDFYDWDYSFYSNMLTKAKHNIARNDIRQYFPTLAVVRSVLDHFEAMLGLQITRVSDSGLWCADVAMYEVWEAGKGKFVGYAYLDLFTRPGKYNGAAVWSVRPGFARQDGMREYPVAAMVANFSPPTSTMPALLDHCDIKILLHELTHLFHNICSVTKWSRFHGTSCDEADYVEAVSQMMEYWAWEPEFLRRFSKHYKTGEPIPKNKLYALIDTRWDELGTDKLGQVFLGLFDMTIHNTADGNYKVDELYNRMQNDIVLSNFGDAKVFKVATREHLMSAYAGTYYAYLWAETISADMFMSRFKKDGIDNPKTGMDFRHEILCPGGSREAMVSLKRFLGRKPNSEAFINMLTP